MSLVVPPEPLTLPPLLAGQELDQPTFHERYEAMPPGTWAELIGGVVYMPSPLFEPHGEIDGDVGLWLSHYKRFTKGVRSPRNVSTILGPKSEVQPDLQLRIPEELGGLTRIVGGYVNGPPELVVEISKSSRRIDLGLKKDDYERSGVLEYVVAAIEPNQIRWFVRREGRFVDMAPGPDGVFRSEVFPGLWLDPRALFFGDLDGIIAVLEQGLATPEHAALVGRLAAGNTVR